MSAILTLAALPALAAPNPDKNAYYGETHVHTSWSFDAYIFGNHVTGPEQATLIAVIAAITLPASHAGCRGQ